jgi:predicted RecA/RadA family phage recombinase
MKNFNHKGGVLPLEAPRNLLAGDPFVVGTIFAIATTSAASGSLVESKIHGVFSLPKTVGQAWVSGQRIYWDDANNRCDTASASGPLIGAALADVAAGVAQGGACLSGVCLVSTSPPAEGVLGGNFSTQRAANGNAIFA